MLVHELADGGWSCPECGSEEIAVWSVQDYAVCYDCNGPDQELIQ